MSIKDSVETFVAKLTDSAVYVDTTGRILKSGDQILLFDIYHAIKSHAPYDSAFVKKFNLGVFYKAHNCSKVVIGESKNGNLIVRTLHDKDYKKQSKNFKEHIMINCIIGDYSNMPDDWKNAVNYNTVIHASEKWNSFNKRKNK